MENITNPFTQIDTRLGRIERIMGVLENQERSKEEQKAFLDIDEASALIKLRKSTLYKLICERKIPYYKTGKRVYFKSAELLSWIENGRKPIKI